MKRTETTKALTELLINERLLDRKYYAKEVTLDYGTSHPKRVDVMEFRPNGVMSVSEIEKGIFACYEIKSCYEDVYSGNGLNFYGEKNYIVTTMETYKRLQEDMRNGKLENHIKDFMGVNNCPHFGFIVPVPVTVNVKKTNEVFAEYENPTPFADTGFKLYTIYQQPRENLRKRPMTELLFCMLRAKH